MKGSEALEIRDFILKTCPGRHKARRLSKPIADWVTANKNSYIMTSINSISAGFDWIEWPDAELKPEWTAIMESAYKLAQEYQADQQKATKAQPI